MARVKKKIKTAKTKHTKKFWAILISSITVGVALVVALVLLLVFKPWSSDDEYDYFANVDDSQVFITYSQFSDEKQSYKNYDHIFVFYYNKDSFVPDDDTTCEEIEDAVESLYKAVKEYNEKDTKSETVAFYIINTGARNSSNALSDDASGVTETDQLAYYYNGTYSTYGFNNEKDYDDTLSGSSKNVVSDAILFVNSLN